MIEVILIVSSNVNFLFLITLRWRWKQLQLLNGTPVQRVGISIAWTWKHVGISVIVRCIEMLIVVLVLICHLVINNRWILEIAIALFQVLPIREEHNWRRNQIRIIPYVHFRVSRILELLLLVTSSKIGWLKISCYIWPSHLIYFRLLHLDFLWLNLILNFFVINLFIILVLIRYCAFFSLRSRCNSWLLARIRLLCLKMWWRKAALVDLGLPLSVELSDNGHVINDLLLSILINWISNVDVSLHHQLTFFMRFNHLRALWFERLLICSGVIILLYSWNLLISFMSKRF